MSLRSRLAISYLVVILAGIGLAGPLAWLAVERLYLGTQGANLLAQAKLVAAALSIGEPPPESSPSPYTQLSNTRPGIHTRVIDTQGAVVINLQETGLPAQGLGLDLPQLAQNPAGLVTPEELLARPEIAQALAGKASSAVRRTQGAVGRRILYAAAPVLSSDGSAVQIIYLASPLPDTRWDALPVTMRAQFAGLLLAAALLAGVAGLLLSRRISRPLEQLASASHAVAEGDLNQTVPADPAITELRIVGESFNHMTASLRRADQMKNAFIADVSHELRTPLTVIKGTIETLQDGAVDDIAARGPFLDSMSTETDRLIRLVNDLLLLARADAGALNLQLHPVILNELACSRCGRMEQAASRRQVRLSVSSGEESRVMGDADRLAQVLDNLLDNAIRYSPPGGEVKVSIEREGEQVACRVSDCGSGIPEQHLPFIFERFYRADTSRERGQGGSGLGLAIVRGFVAAHGGHVSASSLEGKGTDITFWLPAA
jgi:signal transduction histidine kinase